MPPQLSWLEHRLDKAGVHGSNPCGGTKTNSRQLLNVCQFQWVVIETIAKTSLLRRIRARCMDLTVNQWLAGFDSQMRSKEVLLGAVVGYGVSLQDSCLEGFDSLGFHQLCLVRLMVGPRCYIPKIVVRFLYEIPIQCRGGRAVQCNCLQNSKVVGSNPTLDSKSCSFSIMVILRFCSPAIRVRFLEGAPKFNWVYCQSGQTAGLGSRRSQVRILPPRPVYAWLV